jgi:hypothetical protein
MNGTKSMEIAQQNCGSQEKHSLIGGEDFSHYFRILTKTVLKTRTFSLRNRQNSLTTQRWWAEVGLGDRQPSSSQALRFRRGASFAILRRIGVPSASQAGRQRFTSGSGHSCRTQAMNSFWSWHWRDGGRLLSRPMSGTLPVRRGLNPGPEPARVFADNGRRGDEQKHRSARRFVQPGRRASHEYIETKAKLFNRDEFERALIVLRRLQPERPIVRRASLTPACRRSSAPPAGTSTPPDETRRAR